MWFPVRREQCSGSTFLQALCAAFSTRAGVWKRSGKNAMVILKKGDCEHCGSNYRYSLWHSGFGDTSYAYCDQCGMLAIINYSNPHVAALPTPIAHYAEIDPQWEPLLKACPCGGSFRRGQSPRCPFCNERLSAMHAAGHIEAHAHGAGRHWQWQNDWQGVYCMAIDDPDNPGSLLQVVDPLLTSDIEKPRPKSRWSQLFSLHR